MIQPADRILNVHEYYFSHKLREITRLREAGHPIINLGIGSPDLMPDRTVINTLIQESGQSGAHGYQPYQGIPEFREAITTFYSHRFGVDVDALSFLPMMGSKEGITQLSLAYLNPNDQVLIPSLSYPTYTAVTQMLGAVPVYFPLLENQQWEPDWSFLDQLDTSKVKLIWLNYPHMPTGSEGRIEWIQRLVKYAKERSILIGYDNPYSFILNKKPLSIFNIDGAEEVAIELNSMSKTFNMAGWRVGWALGKKELIDPVLKIKSNMDSGMFKPIQLSAIRALSLQDDWFDELNEVYLKRKALAEEFLKALGCTFDSHQSGMFIWAKTPNSDGERFTDETLEKVNVFMAPGFIFGDAGAAYLRLSLCASEEILEEALNRVT